MAIGASHLLLFHQTQPELKLKGNSSSNETCLFPGKCLLLNFLGRCKRTAGKRWKPHLSICFLWNVCPCKTATAKVPKCKITRTKVQVPGSSLPSWRSTLLPPSSSSLLDSSSGATVPRQTQTVLSRYIFTLIKIEFQSINQTWERYLRKAKL